MTNDQCDRDMKGATQCRKTWVKSRLLI